ncbi:hypothetical protein GCM10023331_36580 [Algivirga pacifica]|uniref:DUF4382 domain-containing protein n=2 Tax=Algivirga pacifica TaxID=1162670 RepID=A0ABP9DKH6_9BACT
MAAAVAVFGFTACESNESGKAIFEVRMTDAPGDYENVFIDVQSIEYNSDSNWVTMESAQPSVFDVLELTAGIDTLLGSEEVDPGYISQIRLILGNNNTLVVDGETHDLKVPSGSQSGLKLQINEELVAGITYSILLDFDVEKSIVEKGNGSYSLKPVIRTITEATSGAISGTVLPDSVSAMAFAIQGEDTIASAATNEEGAFMLRGIAEGSYKVVVDAAEGFEVLDTAMVDVEIGVVAPAGDFTAVEEVVEESAE